MCHPHPIFWLHHSFVDRIFEKWMRRHNKKASEAMTNTDAPMGHNLRFPIVPFFPYLFHEDLFKKSTEFGYIYEDVDDEGNRTINKIII